MFQESRSSSYEMKDIYSLEAEKNLGMEGIYHHGQYFLDTLRIGHTGKDGVSVDRRLVAALAIKDFFWGISVSPPDRGCWTMIRRRWGC